MAKSEGGFASAARYATNGLFILGILYPLIDCSSSATLYDTIKI